MSNQYRKALKGYTTTQGANVLMSKINDLLADFQAEAVMFEYRDLEGERIIKSIAFKVNFNGQSIGIKLPLEWEKTAEVLRIQKAYKNDYHAYRVSLFNLMEWLDAQLAMLTCQMVELPQIFLPYVQSQDGRTLYEVVKQSGFAIGMNDSKRD